MPYYANSLFTPGPRRPLNREQKRIWRARSELQRRAGQITALHVEIGKALLRRLGSDGRCDPCHETLAADVDCCPRTVGEALRRFRRLGMLEWVRRLVRRGQVVRQTSNAYRLLMGEAPIREEKAKLSSSMGSSAAATNRPIPDDDRANADRQIAILRSWPAVGPTAGLFSPTRTPA